MLGRWVRTVLDDAEIVGRDEDSFGQEKPGRQFTIGSGRSHDDRERAAVQPNFQRFFRGCPISADLANPIPNPRDVYGPKRLCHASILTPSHS
jgi:hypothetical protein